MEFEIQFTMFVVPMLKLGIVVVVVASCAGAGAGAGGGGGVKVSAAGVTASSSTPLTWLPLKHGWLCPLSPRVYLVCVCVLFAVFVDFLAVAPSF